MHLGGSKPNSSKSPFWHPVQKGRRENPLGFAVNHVDTDRMAWGGPLFEENCGQRGAVALDGLIKSRGHLVISHAWSPKYAHLGVLFVAEQEIRRHPGVFSVRKEGGGKITCIANDAGPSHRCSMRQGGTGVHREVKSRYP